MLIQIRPPFSIAVRLAETVAEGEEDSRCRSILHRFIGWMDKAFHWLELKLILLAINQQKGE